MMLNDPGNAQPPAEGWLFPQDDDDAPGVPEDNSDFDDDGTFTL
jgi:hypothetical protein